MNRRRVIALGFFDGVHCGHGALLKKARELADSMGCSAAALTFDMHPLQLLLGKQVPLLSQVHDRVRLMKELYSMDEVMVLPFDRAMAEMDWEQFVEQILVGRYTPCHVVCGFDYSFGRKGLGTPAMLREKCRSMGIGCEIIDQVELDGAPVSSTRIRGLLEKGMVEEANRCLGHAYELSGEVIRGKQLGRTLGFPTANMTAADGLAVPDKGVYATKVRLQDGSVHNAVTNVGMRPTVEDGMGMLIESWLPGYEGDLYGQSVRVAFYSRIRGERRFDSLQEMQAEIFRNAAQMEEFFRKNV